MLISKKDSKMLNTSPNDDMDVDKVDEGTKDKDKENSDLRRKLKQAEESKKMILNEYLLCEKELKQKIEEAEELKTEIKDLKEIVQLSEQLKDRNLSTSISSEKEYVDNLGEKDKLEKMKNTQQMRRKPQFESSPKKPSKLFKEFNCQQCYFQGTRQMELNKHINLKHSRSETNEGTLKWKLSLIVGIMWKESVLKLENYIIFELIRQTREGGGLALGCAKELQPVWLCEGQNQVEAMSIEICVQNLKIRCCIAYGPQENDINIKKEEFWKYIDEDVFQANMSGSGFIMHFDGNLWAGKDVIPGDPRPQNRNGKLFKEFLDRHPHLSVVNGLPQCEGLITRSRIKDGVKEISVLDLFVVRSKVLPFIKRMVIDER